MENELLVVVNKAGIAQEKSQRLLKDFAGYFDQAKKIAESANTIVVTDESQVDIMKHARTQRLALREVRISVENTRKDLKEESLREGKAIDGIANLIKALIIPVEEHLEQMEKFAEIKAIDRIEKRLSDRKMELSKYVSDVSVYQLRDMAEPVYERLLAGAKAARELEILVQKKADEDRIAYEQKKEEFRKRELQLAPYSDFMIDWVLTENTSQEEFEKQLEFVKHQKVLWEQAQEQTRAENEKLKIQAEKDRKEKEDVEIKLKQERELKEHKELEEKKKAEDQKRLQEEEARKKLLAPDKDKLFELASLIEATKLPAVSSKEAGSVIRATEEMIGKMTNYIREKAKAL